MGGMQPVIFALIPFKHLQLSANLNSLIVYLLSAPVAKRISLPALFSSFQHERSLQTRSSLFIHFLTHLSARCPNSFTVLPYSVAYLAYAQVPTACSRAPQRAKCCAICGMCAVALDLDGPGKRRPSSMICVTYLLTFCSLCFT